MTDAAVETSPDHDPRESATVRAPAGTGSSRSVGEGWRGVLALIALSVLASFALYAPALDAPFVFDDTKLVVENDALWEGQGFDFRVFADRRSDEVRTNFRPVRFVSYQLDAWLTRISGFVDDDGPDPFYFHAQNSFWHGLNAVLILGIIYALTRRFVLSAVVAALFLVHPLHSESVAYVSGRRDVLFAFFYLLGVCLFARSRLRWSDRTATLRTPNLMTLVLIPLCYVTAMFTKEMAATLPVALLSVELLARVVARHHRPSSSVTPTNGMSPSLGVLFGTLTILLFGFIAYIVWSPANPGAGVEFWGGSRLDAIALGARAIWIAIGLCLWPSSLSIDYSMWAIEPQPGTESTGLWSAVAIGGIVIGLLVSVIFCVRRQWGWGLPFPLFLALWSPVSQMVLPHPERFAERFTYLPSVVVIASVVFLIDRVLSSRFNLRVANVALVSVALIVGIVSLQSRLTDWASPRTLWQSAVDVHPTCARAWVALGHAIRVERIGSRGDQRELDRVRAIAAYDRGIDLYAKAEELEALHRDLWRVARTFRAALWADGRDPDELRRALSTFEQICSEAEAREGREGEPSEIPALRRERVSLFLRLGEHRNAFGEAERLVAHPETPSSLAVDACVRVGTAALGSGDPTLARAAFVMAERACQSDAERGLVAFQRGAIEASTESWERAQKYFERAAHLYEGEGSRTSALFREAECWVRIGDVDAARRVLVRSLAVDPSHWPSVRLLAELDLAAGAFDRAEAGLRRVVLATADPVASDLLQRVRVERQIARQDAEAAGTDPKRPRILVQLAAKLMADREYGKARTALDRAEEELASFGESERETRQEARRLRGETEARAGEWAAAATAYETYLAQASLDERALACRQYAEVLSRLERTEDAYEYLESEYERGVEVPTIPKNLGRFALELGRIEDGIRWYRLYHANAPTPEEKRVVEAFLEGLGVSVDPEKD